MTRPLKLGKGDFLCPFAWIKAIPWCKRNQPLGEALINIRKPSKVKKTQKGNKKQTAQNSYVRIQRMLEPNLDSLTVQLNLTKQMNSK